MNPSCLSSGLYRHRVFCCDTQQPLFGCVRRPARLAMTQTAQSCSCVWTGTGGSLVFHFTMSLLLVYSSRRLPGKNLTWQKPTYSIRVHPLLPPAYTAICKRLPQRRPSQPLVDRETGVEKMPVLLLPDSSKPDRESMIHHQ